MTIGIGVLCSSKPRPHKIRPDGFILMADTMGSTDTDSTPELHKLYATGEENIFSVCAGRVEMASEVLSIFHQELAKHPTRTHGNIWDALNTAVHEHRMSHFKWDVLAPKHMFMPGKLLEEQHPKVMEDWQQYDVGLWMIVGTFHDCGTALLYQVGQFWDASGQSVMPGLVHSYAYPGYATIGTGGVNANFWLNFRQQHLGLNPRQSAYHAYEAKVMAAKAPTVNDNLEMVVAFADRHFVLTAEKPEVDDCPISLTELKSMFNKYGPQDTNELGHKKQLGKQKKAAG